MHRSVLLHESIDALAIEPSDTIVDATLGGAGHARAIVSRLGPRGTYIGFDLDEAAIWRGMMSLSDAPCTVTLIKANFRDMQRELADRGITRIDGALFDLGWSSDELSSGRGFSFQRDEPLLMTYSSHPKKDELTASVIVNEWEESSLADILFGWGEERYARRIARAITLARKTKPIARASELADIVRNAVPSVYRHGRIDPATKTFQALRIAVNDELGALDEGLRSAWHLLAPSGRLAVISFHSIEDRLVKHLFLDLEKTGGGVRTPKRFIPPTKEEVRANPRARSAKLRVLEKNV